MNAWQEQVEFVEIVEGLDDEQLLDFVDYFAKGEIDFLLVEGGVVVLRASVKEMQNLMERARKYFEGNV